MENMNELMEEILERFDRIEAKLDFLLDCVEQTEHECDDADIMPFGRERSNIETL